MKFKDKQVFYGYSKKYEYSEDTLFDPKLEEAYLAIEQRRESRRTKDYYHDDEGYYDIDDYNEEYYEINSEWYEKAKMEKTTYEVDEVKNIQIEINDFTDPERENNITAFSIVVKNDNTSPIKIKLTREDDILNFEESIVFPPGKTVLDFGDGKVDYDSKDAIREYLENDDCKKEFMFTNKVPTENPTKYLKNKVNDYLENRKEKEGKLKYAARKGIENAKLKRIEDGKQQYTNFEYNSDYYHFVCKRNSTKKLDGFNKKEEGLRIFMSSMDATAESEIFLWQPEDKQLSDGVLMEFFEKIDKTSDLTISNLNENAYYHNKQKFYCNLDELYQDMRDKLRPYEVTTKRVEIAIDNELKDFKYLNMQSSNKEDMKLLCEVQGNIDKYEKNRFFLDRTSFNLSYLEGLKIHDVCWNSYPDVKLKDLKLTNIGNYALSVTRFVDCDDKLKITFNDLRTFDEKLVDHFKELEDIERYREKKYLSKKEISNLVSNEKLKEYLLNKCECSVSLRTYSALMNGEEQLYSNYIRRDEYKEKIENKLKEFGINTKIEITNCKDLDKVCDNLIEKLSPNKEPVGKTFNEAIKAKELQLQIEKENKIFQQADMAKNNEKQTKEISELEKNQRINKNIMERG